MKAFDMPNGYILFSEAIRRLEMSMWGNLRRPLAVRQVKGKKGAKKLSIGFGPWRQKASERLTRAASQGKLAIYLAHQDQKTTKCTIVPANVVKRLITSRGVLRDRPIQPSLKACDGDGTLFRLFGEGFLVVREQEFRCWHQAEYKKGRWPSQRSRSKRGEGRPTKQTESLRNAVLARMHDGVWAPAQSVNELRRLLTESGRDDVPSADTLASLVDNLHDETGDPKLRRIIRAGRHPSK
jgi:hypothetical protein